MPRFSFGKFFSPPEPGLRSLGLYERNTLERKRPHPRHILALWILFLVPPPPPPASFTHETPRNQIGSQARKSHPAASPFPPPPPLQWAFLPFPSRVVPLSYFFIFPFCRERFCRRRPSQSRYRFDERIAGLRSSGLPSKKL